MSLFEKNTDTLSDYLDGNLKGKRLSDFQKKLASNYELAEEVRDLQDTIAAIKLHHRRELKNKLQNIAAKQPPVNPKEKEGKHQYIRIKLWAASLVALFLSIYFYWMVFVGSALTNQELFETYFSPYPNIVTPVIRGHAPSKEDFFTKAMHSYEKKQYTKALELFQRMAYNSPSRKERLFYQSNCYLALLQTNKAIQNLQQLSQEFPEFYPSQRIWYLGLAYIQAGDLKKAHGTLQKLGNSSLAQQHKLKELLQKL